MTTQTLPAEPRQVLPGRHDVLRGAREAGPRLRDLVVHGIAQVRIYDKPYAGVMHALLFWGVTIQLVGTTINLLQMKLFSPFVLTAPRGSAYLAYELALDLAGVAILAGVAMAAFRRGVLRPRALTSRWDDWYALGLLALIPVVGFALEGLRLHATSPAWSAYSPVGSAVAEAYAALGISSAAAAAVHVYAFWLHAGLALLLLASIPFTKMRHLVAMPLSIALHPRRRPGTLETIADIESAESLGAGHVGELRSDQLIALDACVRCGRCEESCPVAICGVTQTPRSIVQSMRQAMVDTLVTRRESADTEIVGSALADDAPWHCTTCGACLSACPAFVSPVDNLIELRRYQTMSTGNVPPNVADALRNIERQNNPWGLPADDRARLVRELGLRELQPGDHADVLLFLGCAFTYDERNRKAARSLVSLLREVGTDAAVLGTGEMCCGDTARRLGHEYLFQELARENSDRLAGVSVNRIVTQCPHCYNALKREYAQLGTELKVQHYTEYLTEIAPRASANRPSSPVAEHVAYHDSCYLGRYNHIYAAPRRLLDDAGVHRVEMPRHGADSFCCGGGGGQMWMETDPDKRINQRRLEDVVDAGADVVATACPFCLLMFDDAIRTRGLGDKIRVMDVAEVLVAGLIEEPAAAADVRN